MRLLSVIFALLVLSCGVAYSEDTTNSRDNYIYVGDGVRFVNSDIKNYTGNAHPIFFNVGFSRNLFSNLYLDLSCSAGAAGNSNSGKSGSTTKTETKIIYYVEPAAGLIYKFKSAGERVFPSIEAGGCYVKAKAKNNVDYIVNNTASAFGGYAGIGINIKAKNFEFAIVPKYSYIPITFVKGKKVNLGGPGLHLKAGYNF